MIPFTRRPEPATFDERVRQRGQRWLSSQRAETTRPPDYWSEFRGDLALAFQHLCAYCAMYLPDGQVDHFVSRDEDPAQLYEWNNYRYAAGSINSSKKHLRSGDLLDPFEMEDGWFELLLPSLELVLTERCPGPMRERARTMLVRLKLGRDRQIIRMRQGYLEQFESGHLSLKGLRRYAPLVAAAVHQRLAGIETTTPKEWEHLAQVMASALTMSGLRDESPTLYRRICLRLHEMPATTRA